MANLILTPAELASLTGYRRATEQARFLAAAGVAYRLNRCGQVIVARANAERWLGVRDGPQETVFTPNFAALRRLA